MKDSQIRKEGRRQSPGRGGGEVGERNIINIKVKIVYINNTLNK
jgi:hypothetical protein